MIRKGEEGRNAENEGEKGENGRKGKKGSKEVEERTCDGRTERKEIEGEGGIQRMKEKRKERRGSRKKGMGRK